MASGIFLFAVLLLEFRGLNLTKAYRFSPSIPLILAAPFCPEVGTWPVVVGILLDSVLRHQRTFADNLALALAPASSLLVAAALLQSTVPTLLSLALTIAVYLIVRFYGLSYLDRHQSKEERVVWRRVHLQIRPLEVGLGTATVLVFFGFRSASWAVLFFLPLLASLRFAAKNALLRSQEEAVSEGLHKIEKLQRKQQHTQRVLLKTKEQKRILENFSNFIAGRPRLSDAADSIVKTAEQVLAVDNVALFLGVPPEPFAYRLNEVHSQRIQSVRLTKLREPAIDEAMKTQSVVARTQDLDPGKRLFCEDRFVIASPLSTLGVLYLGSSSEALLGKSSVERVAWLSQKAELAISTAQKSQLEKEALEEKSKVVEELSSEIDVLTSLIETSRLMSSTLDLNVLQEKFLQQLQSKLPNDGGLFIHNEQIVAKWGLPLELDPRFMQELCGRRQSFLSLDSKRISALTRTEEARALICAALCSGNKSLGVACLVSRKAEGLGRPERDKLFLLCSQAAMAFSNAEHFHQVLLAQKQLEESQAMLIQSNKMAALSQLSGGVAHQLNSPLGAISLCLEGAQEMIELNPASAKKMLGRGREALDRAKNIINRMMDFSARSDGDYKPISVEELVRVYST